MNTSKTALREAWDISKGYQFFMCDEMHSTQFKKTSYGGIMGHRYFDFRKLFGENVPSKLSEIAEGLRQITWK